MTWWRGILCCLCLLCMGVEARVDVDVQRRWQRGGRCYWHSGERRESTTVTAGWACSWGCGARRMPTTLAMGRACTWRCEVRRLSTTVTMKGNAFGVGEHAAVQRRSHRAAQAALLSRLATSYAGRTPATAPSLAIGVLPAQQHPATLSLAAPRSPLSQHTPIPPQSTPEISSPPPIDTPGAPPRPHHAFATTASNPPASYIQIQSLALAY